ncbi:MAG: o-succinylbenzoate--CoA ligase [Pasteurellaceae bacterium]|nr:o-succinylbenzoate--CoA ligase [Pasteurellaceae bacterium]
MATFSRFPTADWAEKQPQAIAVRWKKGKSHWLNELPEQISWQYWHQLVRQGGEGLQQHAICTGNLIAYVGSHRLLSLLCYCSALAIGAKIVLINPAMTESQRAALLNQLGIQRLLYEEDFANYAMNSPPCRLSNLDFSEPATLTLTSGSSGVAKAVVHSLHHHLANAQGVCELMAFHATQSWLLSLPLFHVSGQGIVWRWLSCGATLVVNEEKTDFYTTLAEVSHASLVPTQLQRYLACDLPKPAHQHILLGGAFISPALVQQARAQQITTYSGYGMTEMASTVCAAKNQIDMVGSPLVGREVRLEQGEIWVRGAGLGLGYWQQGNIVPLVNAQGWFPTKDKGEWHNGQLRILGRQDNQFISGGENIQPEQIERVLLQSGLLKQAMVVPIADPEFGQRPVAAVEFIGAWSEQAVRSLQQFVTIHLEKFKHPVHYVCFSTFSFNTGIKVARHMLQKAVAEQFQNSR